MPITNDIRSYADTALEQGKQVVDQAQAQLNDVTEQANEFVGRLTETAKVNVSDISGKASDAVNDLRAQAEKSVNFDVIKAAVEPLLTQAKGYTATVTDRAEDLFATVKSDKRVAKLVTTAESVTGAVLQTVQDRVVTPVQSLTGMRGKPAPKRASKPAAKSTPARAATKSTPKSAAKTTARKAPAKKAVSGS